MKFRIEATSIWSDSDLIDRYPMLEKFNYEFTGKVAYVVINTLEELIELMNTAKEELIIKRHWGTDELTVEIYDSYRE